MLKTKEMFSQYNVLDDGTIIDKYGNVVKTFKSNQYLQCCLFDNKGRKHTMGVHSAIGLLALDDWYDGCVVHHIDGDYHNNKLNNLMVISRKNHTKMHIENGELYDIGQFAKKHFVGKNNPKAKPVMCVELNRTFDTITEASKILNVPMVGISCCCHGKRNTSGGYHWRFV